MNQCLVSPLSTLKEGGRGAESSLNLSWYWGAGVKGAWLAGGASTSRNGFSVSLESRH